MFNLLKLYKNLLLSDLSSFIHKAFTTVNPATEYLPNWHIDLIADRLEQVTYGKIRRLIINMPPRALKSLSVTVAWPAWLLANRPDSRIIAASYSQALSNKHSIDTRLIINSPWYQQFFPQTRLTDDQNQKAKFMTSERGFRLATSIGGTLTGEGGDFLILDDPHNPVHIYSAKYRDNAINWFEQTFCSRLDDKKKGVIVIVMQRLHEDDLCGYLLKKQSENWQILSLPAIAEQQYIFSSKRGVKTRNEGSLLHLAREGQEEISRAKLELGVAGFNAQYQQDPLLQTGGMIKRDWLKFCEKMPHDVSFICQSWDTAIKVAKENDYTVCTTWLVNNNMFILAEVVRVRVEYPELKKIVVSLYEKWQADAILIEDKASGQSLLQDLRAETSLPLIAIHPTTDKLNRLNAVTPLFEAGRVHIYQGEWLEEYLKELLAFPATSNDDQVDSTSQFLNYIKRNSGLGFKINSI